jgi:MATE family multidrug resistance protein
MRELLLFNRDLMIRTLILMLTFAVFMNLGSMMGTTVLAANAVLMKVQLLAAYLVDGLAYATEALAGIYLGAGKRRRLKKLVIVASQWGVAAGTLVAVAFAVQPGPLYGLLTDHEEVLVRLSRDTRWLLPILSIGSVAYILDGYFIGLTQGRVLVRSMIVSSGLGFFPLAMAAWFWNSPDLLWAAMTGWMVLRTLTLVREVPATWA